MASTWYQKINRDRVKPTEFRKRMDLTEIFGTFCPKKKEYIFFSTPHGNFSKWSYTWLRRSRVLSKNKKIEMIPCTLSDHHELSLIFINKKKTDSPHTHGK